MQKAVELQYLILSRKLDILNFRTMEVSEDNFMVHTDYKSEGRSFAAKSQNEAR